MKNQSYKSESVKSAEASFSQTLSDECESRSTALPKTATPFKPLKFDLRMQRAIERVKPKGYLSMNRPKGESK